MQVVKIFICLLGQLTSEQINFYIEFTKWMQKKLTLGLSQRLK